MERLPDDELLSAYLDDELSAEQRAEAKRLTAERPEMRRLLEELRGVRESLHALPSYRLENDFQAGVLRRAEREMLQDGNAATTTLAAEPPAETGWNADRMRRPLVWSLLAVAAAVVFMFVERRQQNVDRQVAVNAPRPAAGLPRDERKAIDRKNVEMRSAERETSDAAPSGNTDRAVAPLRKGGSLPSSTPQPSAPQPSAHPAPAPTEVANPFVVSNMLPPAAAPAGSAVLNGLNAATVDGVMSQSTPYAEPSAQIDTTPIVAFNDFERGRSLVADFNEIRRDAGNDRDAARSFAQQLQVAPTNRNRVQQIAPADSQVLVVQCDVTPEALELGLAPVLQRNRIADLTALRTYGERSESADANVKKQLAGAMNTNAASSPTDAPATQAAAADKAASADEQFYYIVAESGQLEATLDALRDQPEYFVNVNVEPAPASARQQAWRSYNRGVEAAAAPLPTTVPLPVAAMQLPQSAAGGGRSSVIGDAKPNESQLADGEALRRAGVPPSAPTSAATNQAYGPMPAQTFGGAGVGGGGAYDLQGRLSPLSRGQRILPSEAESVASAAQAKREAGEKTKPLEPIAAPSGKPAADSAVDTLKETDAAKAVAKGDVAALPTDAGGAWYGNALPPDYHEALFIFRVVKPTAVDAATSTSNTAPKPAAEPATASPQAKPK